MLGVLTVGGLFGISDGLHLSLDGAADVGAATRLEDEKSRRWTGPVSAFQSKSLSAEAVPSHVSAASVGYYHAPPFKERSQVK